MNQFTIDDLLDLLGNEKEFSVSHQYINWELCRRDIAKRLGCSYSTANRLVHKAKDAGLIKLRWTHQNQNYWEGWISID